jgi:hypothetical protein
MLKLHVDYRLGGIPRYSIADNPEHYMIIPDEIRKSVVFVCYKDKSNNIHLAGTGFFIFILPEDQATTILGFNYLVTAKHVLIGIGRKSIDQKVYLRVNLVSGGSTLVACDLADWKYHPEDPSVDAAILAWMPPQDQVEFRTLPHTMFATEQVIKQNNIGIGDEVFIAGLFVNHFGKAKNLPIIRTGNIALMPEERIAVKDFGSIEAYLIEARSIGGLSGSPVFVHLYGTRPTATGTELLGGSKFFLLGLMHGHWDLPVVNQDLVVQDTLRNESVNMGIAIVVPGDKIMEIANQPDFKDARDKAIQAYRKGQLPTADEIEQGGIIEQGFTKSDFEEALKKVSRPDQPQPDKGKSETSE